MDTNAIIVFVIAVIAVIAIAAYLIYRQHAKVNLRPTNESHPSIDRSSGGSASWYGVQIENATAQKGSVVATNKTGTGVAMRHVEAGQDIRATNTGPKQSPKV